MCKAVTAPPDVAFDTGPLLCFGHIAGGIRIVRGRYFGRMRWTAAVAAEIANHANRARRHRDNLSQRYQAELAKAASPWNGPQKGLLGEPHRFADRGPVERMRALVRAESTRPALGDRNLGEAETLLYAQQASAVALIDENAGRAVAQNLGLPVHCTVDVLIAEYLDGRIELPKLRALWEQIRSSALDGGEVLPSTRSELRRWKSPAPR